MPRLSLVLLLVILFSFQSAFAQTEEPEPQPTEATESDEPFRVVGYFIEWGIYERQYFVTDIPAEKLTHINYAFANISEEGVVVLGDPWADIEIPYPDDPEDAPLKGNFRQLQRLKMRMLLLEKLKLAEVAL